MATSDETQGTSTYQTNKTFIVVMIVHAIVGAVISFFIASESKTAKGWVAAVWAVVPPIWFWYEYTYLTTEAQKANKDFRDRLKFAQDTASRVWLAVGGVFTATYFEAFSSLLR